MENSEEKFFESLAKSGHLEPRVDETPGVEFELAKTSASSAAGTKPPVKKTNSRSLSENSRSADAEPEGQLTLDVYQTLGEIVIESAIAGVQPEDIDINVSPDSVTIRGARHRDQEISEEDYFYQECYWGRFSRSVILPQEVDPDGAWVNFKNGILTVHLPKVTRTKAKKLKVRLE